MPTVSSRHRVHGPAQTTACPAGQVPAVLSISTDCSVGPHGGRRDALVDGDVPVAGLPGEGGECSVGVDDGAVGLMDRGDAWRQAHAGVCPVDIWLRPDVMRQVVAQ